MADAFADWTRRLCASDDRALDELMRFIHPALLRYATRLVGERDAAYDILQETFVKIWQVRNTLDPGRSLKALLYRIVYTRALNHNRMKKRAKEEDLAMVRSEGLRRPTVEEEMDAHQLGVCMNQWIDELPTRRQEAFRLSRFEGLSHQEIAMVMELSKQTVTKHIMLALQHLRDRLNTYQASGQRS